MRKSLSAIAPLLLACCASAPTTPTAVQAPAIEYKTQDTCHPDIPLLDTRDPRVVAPKLISKVEPVMPEDIRAARQPLHEIVIFEAIIDENGNVIDVCPFKGDPRLVQAAMNAVRQWKFAPGTIDGKPSAFRFNATSNFRLN